MYSLQTGLLDPSFSFTYFFAHRLDVTSNDVVREILGQKSPFDNLVPALIWVFSPISSIFGLSFSLQCCSAVWSNNIHSLNHSFQNHPPLSYDRYQIISTLTHL